MRLPKITMNADELCDGIVFRVTPEDSPTSNTFSTSSDTHFSLDSGVVLYPEVAISLWERMLALPHAEQMRCHTPRYAIHLAFGDGQYCTAAICWECNNISVSSNGDYSWRTFDGESVAAQALLSDIRGYIADAP